MESTQPTLEQSLTHLLAASSRYQSHTLYSNPKLCLEMQAVAHPAEFDLPSQVEINLTFDEETSVLLAFEDTWEQAQAAASHTLDTLKQALYGDFQGFLPAPKSNSARRAELETPLLKWAKEACKTERAKCGDLDEDYIPSWLPELEAAIQLASEGHE